MYVGTHVTHQELITDVQVKKVISATTTPTSVHSHTHPIHQSMYTPTQFTNPCTHPHHTTPHTHAHSPSMTHSSSFNAFWNSFSTALSSEHLPLKSSAGVRRHTLPHSTQTFTKGLRRVLNGYVVVVCLQCNVSYVGGERRSPTSGICTTYSLYSLPCIYSIYISLHNYSPSNRASYILYKELEKLTTSCSVQLNQVAVRVLFGKVGAQSLLYQTPHRRHTLCELIA